MNKKILNTIIFSCLLVVLALFAASCSKDKSPYPGYNKAGYTVSVKYDANGGTFTTDTRTIIDTYDLSEYTVNSEGKKEIKLFAPDDAARGNQAYNAEKIELVNGKSVYYYLAGWYANRTEVVGENGEVTYKYSGRWDFEKDKLALDANKKYDAGEPEITLYAAWVPAFRYEFYTFDASGNPELLGIKELNPTKDTSIILPALNEKTGKIGDNNGFPSLTNKTYDKIYFDAEKTSEITGTALTHSGVFKKDTAELENPVMKVYCTTLDGLWFEIDSPQKIASNAFLNANYILKCDIDFNGAYWPSNFLTKNFEGSIIGNGYSIKNVTITQNDNTCVNFGLFGQITAKASLKDVTFDGITVKIEQGSRMQGANFGILAGTVSDSADISNVTVKNSKFVITSNSSRPLVTNVSYGLVSGYGSLEGIEFSENNTVTFTENGSAEYDYELDSELRFHLTKKQAS